MELIVNKLPRWQNKFNAFNVTLEIDTTPTCDAIYTKFDGSEVCSYSLKEKYDWQGAAAACDELGARLPSIEDVSDTQVILDLKVC